MKTSSSDNKQNKPTTFNLKNEIKINNKIFGEIEFKNIIKITGFQQNTKAEKQ